LKLRGISAIDLVVPAQESDPEEQQHEKANELGPHYGEEPTLLDLLLMFDIGLSMRFLGADQQEIAGGYHLVALLV